MGQHYLQSRRVRIVQLQQGTGLSVVKLWLVGLLGEFEMWQRGGFYDGAGVAIAWLQ
jgi:hypothetical protein